MKTFILRSFIGIFFGGFIAVLYTNLLIYFGHLEMIDGSLFLKNSLGSIFSGWFFTVSPMYFEVRTLKLHQQTILHFLTIMVLYPLLAFSIGWVPFTLKHFLLLFIIAIVVYAISWTAFYLFFKHQARKLNDDLNKIC
ncbi:hypothetical protein WQ54_06430 [Bacillus sp. SA1-12]|uniref:DUF3021 domain-containing protein n=1 Tax=Bacillus sp. SA1-12 TaxID=1455638 RepID=UPI0006253F81|nr:DUF3021 domain-containing protein [Bacillus sp. SA1-12]KKI92825.1 hypothetical protein WQ54_06430 [Bacillus sp. SA1-12]